MIAKEAAFHSKTEVTLESTDTSELFSKMKDTVLESLTKFQRQGSNWRFHSVLDLHTVKYVPLGGSSYIPLPKFQASILKMRMMSVSMGYYTSIKSSRKKTLKVLIKNFQK